MTPKSPPHRHLVLFAKAPRMGRVKTRLARDIGRVRAWAIYRRLLVATARRLCRDGRWRCWLAVTPDRSRADNGLWPTGWTRIGQGGGDLGQRMARVIRRRLPPGPVVIVGSDIPDMRRDHVSQAFRALGRADAVFGPAPDGGYWLVGLKRRPRRLDPFSGVRWSTEHALADSRANLAGRRVVLLETLEDLDDGGALTRLRSRSAGPGAM